MFLLQYWYDHVFCFYFKDDNLSWMMAESLRLKEEGKLPNEGFYGGILIDEMAIQQDLTIVKKGKSMHLIGNVNLGPTCTFMEIITKKTK